MQRIAPRTNRFACLVPQGGQPVTENVFLRLLARSPAVREAYLTAESALAQGALTTSQREMIALTVAEINNSQYGVAVHGAAGRLAGLTEQDVELARRASAAEPRNLAMLHFARAVALQRGEVSDTDFSRLRAEGFSDAEITEIVAHVALNVFANYLNNVARTQPEAATAARICG